MNSLSLSKITSRSLRIGDILVSLIQEGQIWGAWGFIVTVASHDFTLYPGIKVLPSQPSLARGVNKIEGAKRLYLVRVLCSTVFHYFFIQRLSKFRCILGSCSL